MSWRTNPGLVRTEPRLLAQKLREAGWAALSEEERTLVITRFAEVLEHLSEMERAALAEQVGLPLPAALPPAKPQRPTGKQTLIARLKARRNAT